MNKLIAVIAAFLLCSSSANAAKPTWARKAVAFPQICHDVSKSSSCKPRRIDAPDKQRYIEVIYKKTQLEEEQILEAVLRVTTPAKGTREVSLPDGFQNVDLLWSPDSTAFFVNGGNGGAYWGFWVYSYIADDEDLKPIDITRNAERDMIRTFPPCKATMLSNEDCKSIESRPDYNMSGIDWLPNSSVIVIMAEVPCSGISGGIMCQVMGYEVTVRSGRIVKRLDARQLKKNWQGSMQWRFKVPDPPDYE